MKKQLYIFSGLGADERVFQKLDFSEFSPVFIKWIDPLKNETIEAYATRLLAQIPATKPILLGLSFGGIMAIEVAKQISTEKVIIMASAKVKEEIPLYFRLAGMLRLYKLLPAGLLKSSNAITNWFFGISSVFEKQLLKQILIDTNPIFLKWAIEKVARWENKTRIGGLFHIHGDCDRILPLRNLNCDIVIKGGGHLMTLNKERELNEVLRKVILHGI